MLSTNPAADRLQQTDNPRLLGAHIVERRRYAIKFRETRGNVRGCQCWGGRRWGDSSTLWAIGIPEPHGRPTLLGASSPVPCTCLYIESSSLVGQSITRR